MHTPGSCFLNYLNKNALYGNWEYFYNEQLGGGQTILKLFFLR